jgi:hypothetical protein
VVDRVAGLFAWHAAWHHNAPMGAVSGKFWATLMHCHFRRLGLAANPVFPEGGFESQVELATYARSPVRPFGLRKEGLAGLARLLFLAGFGLLARPFAAMTDQVKKEIQPPSMATSNSQCTSGTDPATNVHPRVRRISTA